MIGAIRKSDIFSHWIVTWRCFGWRVLFHSLFSSRQETFLSLLAHDVFQPQTESKPAQNIAQCVQLELTAQRIYTLLAKRFEQDKALCAFFKAIGRQEAQHGELLKICKTLANLGNWDQSLFSLWEKKIQTAETQMKNFESKSKKIDSPLASLQLVLAIESSEINPLFTAVVTATTSKFVQSINAYQSATQKHIKYISKRIPEFFPELTNPCKALRKKFNL